MDTREIRLTKGKVAVVDADDFDRLSRWKWQTDARGYASRNRSAAETGSRTRVQGYGRVYMHREILGVAKGVQVDHRNGNRLDNRKANLRPATAAQNQQNRGLNRSRVGFKGVTFDKQTGRWRALLNSAHLGRFDTAEQAARAYDAAAIQRYGEFARTNESLGLLP